MKKTYKKGSMRIEVDYNTQWGFIYCYSGDKMTNSVIYNDMRKFNDDLSKFKRLGFKEV